MRRAALAVMASAAVSSAAAQEIWPGAPPVSPETRSAVRSTREGSTAELTRLADLGSADAQVFAGAFLIFGARGYPKDGARGCAYVAKAAATRSDGMHLLGECYQYGYGGEMNAEKAIVAFHRAGDMGSAKSRCAEGNVLIALKRDTAHAVELCREGADGGDRDAQADLGNFYLQGKLVARDVSAARKWYEKAAAQQQPNAAFVLGQIYWNGDGVGRDTGRAAQLWRLAYDGGRRDAAVLLGDEALERAVRKLDANQAALVVAGQASLDQGILAEALDWYGKAMAGASPAARTDIEERLAKARLSLKPNGSQGR